jgi:diguanylate cyclase (GGDEF)-like protein
VVRLVRADGSIISVELTCAPVLDGSRPSGRIISHLQDVTDRRAEQERLTRAARTDPLTGLWNRATLFEQLEAALARRDRRHETVTVLFCDIDDFKSVNDNHGHHIGDGVLVGYAERLTAVKRPTDIAARFAGDEFVLVYENGPHLDTDALVDRLHHVLSRPFTVDGVEVVLTTSIGTAVAAEEEITAVAMLQRADQSMYGVKALHGRSVR